MIFKQHILALLTLLFTLSAHATEVGSNGFTFQLPGEWELAPQDNGSLLARQSSSDGYRVFIMSAYFIPKDAAQAQEALQVMQGILDSMDSEHPELEKVAPFTPYTTASGTPFHYITYFSTQQQSFFTGASLGTDRHVVMITYEGSGEAQQGADELKAILETVQYRDE